MECKTCWECIHRIGEECGFNGREVWNDTDACDSFEEEGEQE